MLFNRFVILFKYLFFCLLLLLVIILGGVNLPFARRFITEKANSVFFEKKIPVHVGKIKILITGRLGLSEVQIIKNQGDTIVYAGGIKVSVRILPLIFHKVKITGVTINNATVNIRTDPESGELNIISIFSPGNKPSAPDTRKGKKWDISIGSVYLSNVRFSMNDSINGIHIYQTVKELTVTLEKFSLAGRQIFASYISIKDAGGGIVLDDSDETPAASNRPGAAWAFRLKNSDLNRISFTLSQPAKRQKMHFQITTGMIRDASVDLGVHKIIVGKADIGEPVVKILSDPVEYEKAKVSSGSSVDFPGYWDISGKNLKISGGSFQTRPYAENEGGNAAGSAFMATGLNTLISDLRISSSLSHFSIDDFSFALENGFRLEEGQLIFNSDPTMKTTFSTKLRTSLSHVNLLVESASGLTEIIRSYKSASFRIKASDSEISAGDIFSFLPTLLKNQNLNGRKDFRLAVNCDISGNSDMLKIKLVDLKTWKGASVALSGEVEGLKDPPSAKCSIDFNTGQITPAHLREFLSLFSSSFTVPEFDPVSAEGSVDSILTVPRFRLALKSNSGNMDIHGDLNTGEKSYNLQIKGSHINIGKFTGVSDLGIFTGKLDLTGRYFTPAEMRLTANLEIDTVGYKGYNYNKIRAGLDGGKGYFKYDLKADDPSFMCDLTGILNLSDSLTGGKIRGMLFVDAGKANILKGATVSAEIDAGLNKSGEGLNGFASIRDISLKRDENTGNLKNLDLSFEASDTLVKGKISAGFLKAEGYYEGSVGSINKVLREGRFRGIAILDSAVNNRIPYISLMDNMFLTLEASYDPFIGLLVSDTVFSYNKIFLKMTRDSVDIARAEISVDRFNLGQARSYNALISLERNRELSRLVLSADSIRFGPVSLTGLGASVFSTSDSAKVSFYAGDNKNSPLFDIGGMAYKTGGVIKMTTSSEQWVINGYPWKVSPGDFLVMDPVGNDLLADLHLKNDQHKIDIYGRRSDKITFECLDLGVKMILIPGMNNLGYDGEFTGKMDFKGGIKKEIAATMEINRMRMNDEELGSMNISGKYESDTLGNIEGNLNAGMNDSSALKLIVRYGRKADQRSLTAEFSKLPLLIIGSLSRKYITDLYGTLGGRIELKPVNGRQVMDGEIRVNNIGLRLVPVSAGFLMPGDVIRIENNRLLFSGFTVLDSLRNKLELNGSINLSDPGNIIADLQVTSNRIQVMNTTPRDNPQFNGSVFVDSKINLTGELQNPSVQGSLVLAEGTVINYRYTENLAVSETEKVVSFVSMSEDRLQEGNKRIAINRISDKPEIEASLEINPNTIFNFEISKGFDIGVHISGGGFLTYSMLPGKAIDLTGVYEIRQGSSELKIPGWPRKDFTITPGSFVKWDGQVDDPDLRVETTSRVRGSYVNPIDSKTRDVNFLVEMKLAGKLSQLGIIFDVRSEDQYLTSVFNSMSTDERMRQAINLLIFGSVQLPNAAGSSDYMTQQINQFWESQINSFTKSAVKWVDLSMGIDSYKDASKGGTEHTSVSVQVKKDILKDRGSVMVSGRMNNVEQAGQQSNAVIENFIFEYALDSNRTKYLKVYRQQNYEDLLEGEVIKSGVGFIYRKDYNRVRDIWRREEKRKVKK
jgi:translocation and assembly module TamB